LAGKHFSAAKRAALNHPPTHSDGLAESLRVIVEIDLNKKKNKFCGSPLRLPRSKHIYVPVTATGDPPLCHGALAPSLQPPPLTIERLAKPWLDWHSLLIHNPEICPHHSLSYSTPPYLPAHS